MTTLETLLIVLTSAVVIQIIIIIAALVVMIQVLRKISTATDEIQQLAERSTAAADRFEPVGTAAMTVYELIKFISKLRR